MDSKEAFLSAKILVDFVRDFTSLSEQQLIAIRKRMEQTVEDIMQSVHQLSSKADSRVEQASSVLKKDEETDGFKTEKVDSSSAGDKDKANLEDMLRRSGGVFSKHMEALSSIDGDVNDVIGKVIGAVSMDDVMAQRLAHVTDSINLFRRGLAKVVTNFGDFNTQKKVKALRNEILTEVYRSYTAEEEKVIFHKIFGQPKTSSGKKVS